MLLLTRSTARWSIAYPVKLKLLGTLLQRANVTHQTELISIKVIEKLTSVVDQGQTDRITTPTRVELRRCRCPRPLHASRLAALARS